MELNNKPAAERIHIGFFGLRNAGKSSLVNAVTGQELSIVSETKGTTTDPVKKTMELLPLGPVVIIDTPGLDDEGELGEQRIKRTVQTLSMTDIAVLVIDADIGKKTEDNELCTLFEKKKIPYVIAYNKSDLATALPHCGDNEIYVSAKKGTNIREFKELLGKLVKENENDKVLIGDLINSEDVIVLVIPIDESAPKNRLILPQQQMIREILESGAVSVAVRDTELSAVLPVLKKKPRMVITDSQAFERVSQIIPNDILLTSFSILFARYKGELMPFVKGSSALDTLNDGDTVLISEGCTHHRQCNDIGSVKLPRWIETYTKKKLLFEYSSGGSFPDDLTKYALIVHCGGCMLNEREMKSRIDRAGECNIPITNYGIAIARMHGILKRSLAPFDGLVM